MTEEMDFVYDAMIYSKQEEAPGYPEEEGFVICVPTNSGFKRGDHVRVKLKKTGNYQKPKGLN